MTYRQLLLELRKVAQEKFGAYLKAENELLEQGDGFADITYTERLNQARTEWQNASNEHMGVLSFVVKHNIPFDQEITTKK